MSGSVDEITAFVKTQTPGAEVIDETPLIESGLLDSFGIVQLIGHLEDTFGIAFNDEDLVPETFATVNSLAVVVEKKRSSTSST
ncbi:MAG: phosphopantetheine-binding protein [Gemmatimonadetes bacterium]|nr:phosphopantetheine-binding protein [Gemmatimonadota bacterium]|tara:strand:- start:11497 stop:11748 length:252 start_codon:yes stop_codon:yes gene_type:complete